MVNKLRDSVELKFGRKINYQKDCKDLSDSILNSTREQLSSSTLRRFFGFLTTNSNPARVTLDILSRYCGFNNWDEFQKSGAVAPQSYVPLLDLWDKARERAKSISLNYCEQIKRTTPIGYNCTVNRGFAHERIAYFLESNFVATPFVGPGGYGKSTLLVNWYETQLKNRKLNNDILLFVPAIAVEASLVKDRFFETWIQSYLNIEITTELFNVLATEPKLVPGKFILIIDALDEVSQLGYKTERLFSALHQFLAKYSAFSWLKIIISSRYPAWENFFNASTIPNKWFFANSESFLTEDANIPKLNEEEIQQILDNTINNILPDRLIVEEFTYSMLQIISYPYFLQVFIEIFRPDLVNKINDRIDLLSEFLRKRVFQGSFAEEKSDIINKIIEMSAFGFEGATVKKNDLKEKFPIHLKLAGNYYNAYNDLLSYGIIFEETIEKFSGVFIKHVRIPQGQLCDLLVTQNLIFENGGISFQLFKRLEKDYANSESLPYILSTLFEIAYKERNVEALKPLFSLSPITLQKIFSLPNILLCLRNDEYMRRELIHHYATNSLARNLLFENTIDFNAITTSYKFLIQSYLKNVNDQDSVFFANTIIAISGFLTLDIASASNTVNLFNCTEPHGKASPLIAGLFFSCQLLANFFNEVNENSSILDNVELYSQKNINFWTNAQRADFELGLLLGLILTKKYDVIAKRLRYLYSRKEHGNDLYPVEKALTIHLEYSRWKIGIDFNPQVMRDVEGYISELPPWYSYFTLILAKGWLAVYYMSLGNLEKSLEVYQKSIEISNISGYLIYEVKLLKNLIPVLENLGENKRANECHILAKSILEKSGVPFEKF